MRSPLGGGWGEEDREDEAEEEGAESGERPPGGVTPTVPAAVEDPLATGSRCSRRRRRSVDPCSALPAPPGSRGSGEEQHRLGCEEENTRSSTCFRFLKPLHLLPVLPTSCVVFGGGRDGVGVAAVRRSGPPARPPPPPLPLPTPSCRFFQSRAWKEGDTAGSGSPAAAPRGSILQAGHLRSPPTASLPSRAERPPGAWRRRRRPAQQHKPGASSGFRPAQSKAAAEALPPRGAAASAGRTCQARLAPSLRAPGVCKVLSTELRGSRPLSAPRPHPGSPSATAGARKLHAAGTDSQLHWGPHPRPQASTCQQQRRPSPNWARTRLTRLGASCRRRRGPAALAKPPGTIFSSS